MKRTNIVIIHAGASGLALLTVLTFFTSTVIIEIFGNVEQMATLKEKIFFALPLMLIAMPVVGISGKKLAAKSKAPLVQRKLKRMKFIANNGFMLVYSGCFTLLSVARSSAGFPFLPFAGGGITAGRSKYQPDDAFSSGWYAAFQKAKKTHHKEDFDPRKTK